MDPQIIVNAINQHAKENQLFWVAGLARETWKLLRYYKNELHPSALVAVEHYEEPVANRGERRRECLSINAHAALKSGGVG